MNGLRIPLFAIALLTLCFFTGSCMFFTVTPERMEVTKKTASAWSATKVHLMDGSVVVFPRGFSMAKGLVKGQEDGVRYDILRNKVGYVKSVPSDSVVCFQVYKEKFLGRRSGFGLVAIPLYLFTYLVYLVSTGGPDTGRL